MESKWKHFTIEELSCRGNCPNCSKSWQNMNPEFMNALVGMRTEAGFPFPISSGYRCPSRNEEVSNTGVNGPHTTGRCVDIQVYDQHAVRVVELALKWGMKGIGVNQKGPRNKRFIHVDQSPNRKDRTIWTY